MKWTKVGSEWIAVDGDYRARVSLGYIAYSWSVSRRGEWATGGGGGSRAYCKRAAEKAINDMKDAETRRPPRWVKSIADLDDEDRLAALTKNKWGGR